MLSVIPKEVDLLKNSRDIFCLLIFMLHTIVYCIYYNASLTSETGTTSFHCRLMVSDKN